MATQITATLPTLNFPREVDYPTQEDWAAFSAAAELNFGILGNGWSTQMQLWKDQANAMSIESNNNADIAQSIANYQGDWTSKGYTLGQSVSVSGVYYICKLTHITGQNPTDVGSLYWNLALGNWSLKADIKSTNINVNVGTGQTYTTINQALEYLSGFYPMYKKSGVTATINLKAGFVMDEQVLVSGIDLGWITIVGEDAETIIPYTSLTTDFYGTFPAFGVDKGGTSPVIGQLFRFNVEKVGGNKHGLMTWGAGSSANVLYGKGFIGAGTHGIYAYSASTINANGANCSNAGAYGVYAVSSSTINAEGANCSNAGAAGIVAGASSTVNANGANCSNAGNAGIYADQRSTINANGANCSNAGSNGISASTGSSINAYGAIIQNQTTGTARIKVGAGSHIVAFGIDTTGGTVPVFSQAPNTLTALGIIYG